MQVRIDNVDDYDARITVLFRGKEIASFNACAYELPQKGGLDAYN